MKRIRVRLNSFLKKYSITGEKDESLEIPEDSAVSDIVQYYGINRGEILIILIDGRLANMDDKPDENSRVDLYPIFPGG